MEKAKQVGTSATNSFASELFGPKDLSKSSSSSTGHFGALFGPSSTGLGKDSTHSGTSRSQHHHHANHSVNTKQESFGTRGQRNGSTGKDPNSVYQIGTVEPCNNYFSSSSIYYGGQDVYSPHNPNSHHKKDGGEDHDPNGNNATRGNWWQGSLYY